MNRKVGVVCVIFGLLAAACGEEGRESGLTEAEPGLSVALLMTGQINDRSWNQVTYRGAKRIADSERISLVHRERVPFAASELEPVLRGFAEEEHDLVIAAAFQFGDSVFKIAEEFPDGNFAWPGNFGKTERNVADYGAKFHEAAYLAGIAAAGLTETGTLGGVAAFDIPDCHSVLEAFEAGAATLMKSDIQALRTFTGDWADVQKARNAASAQAAQGADVFVTCGPGPAAGTAAFAQDEDLASFGWIGDITSVAPQNVAGNIEWDPGVIFEKMLDDLERGNFNPARFYQSGIADGGVVLSLNSIFEERLSADAAELLKKKTDEIKNGSFEVPFIPE